MKEEKLTKYPYPLDEFEVDFLEQIRTIIRDTSPNSRIVVGSDSRLPGSAYPVFLVVPANSNSAQIAVYSAGERQVDVYVGEGGHFEFVWSKRKPSPLDRALAVIGEVVKNGAVLLMTKDRKGSPTRIELRFRDGTKERTAAVKHILHLPGRRQHFRVEYAPF